MTVPVHRMPHTVFTALGRGGGGAAAIDGLRAARLSKVRLLVRALVARSTEIGHPDTRAVGAGYELLRRLDEYRPQAVTRVLRHPEVGAWAAQTLRLLRGARPAEADPGFLAVIAAVAAATGRAQGGPVTVRFAAAAAQGSHVTGNHVADTALEVPLPPQRYGHLTLPSLGWLCVPSGVDTLVLRPGHGTLEIICTGGDARQWYPVERVEISHEQVPLRVEVDGAPYSPLTFPDGRADRRRPPTVDIGQWRDQLAPAWELLVDRHPSVAQEVSRAVDVLVPLARQVTGTASGTLDDAQGAIYLSAQADPRQGALALAHEIQHTKLAGLADLFALTDAGPEPRYYAPWRDDPRPFIGLFHGAYAHLGVAGFWRRQRLAESDPAAAYRAEVEFSRWSTAAYQVSQVLLTRPGLTAIGRQFVAEMATVARDWSEEPVSAAAHLEARRRAEQHRLRWYQHNALRQPQETASGS